MDHENAARLRTESGDARGLSGFVVEDEICHGLAVLIILDAVDYFIAGRVGASALNIFGRYDLD